MPHTVIPDHNIPTTSQTKLASDQCSVCSEKQTYATEPVPQSKQKTYENSGNEQRRLTEFYEQFSVGLALERGEDQDTC